MKSTNNIMPTFLCDSLEAPLLFLNLSVTICILIKGFIPVAVVLIVVNTLLYKWCAVSLSKTRKLDLRTKVPIRDCFEDLYQGAVQIKCYNTQKSYFRKFNSKLKDYYRANLLYGNVQRATSFIVQAATMLGSVCGLILIYVLNEDMATAQDLLYAIALSDYIQFGVRQIALLDGQLESIQQILELGDRTSP